MQSIINIADSFVYSEERSVGFGESGKWVAEYVC